MENKEKEELIGGLKSYQKELDKISNGKPKRKDMEKFKSYYEKTYTTLVEFIKFSKNKELSEKAKELPLLKKLFSTFNIYMAFLIVIMIGPLSLMVYLYTLKDFDTLIYTMVGIDVIIIFFLVRKIQTESTLVINTLSDAVPIVKNVAKLVEENNKK